MKKLLTILILLLAVASQGWAELTEHTLWNGTYDNGIELNSEVATFKAGDILRVYATVPEGGANFKICYKGESNGWSETAIPSLGENPGQWPWINYNPGYYEFTLTAEDISALSDMNIYIYKGANSTITKVTHIKYFTLSTSATNGSITVKNGDTDVTETKSFQEGTELSLTPNPDEGYIFEKWTIGEEVATENPLTLTMTANVTVTASFSNKSERVLKEESVAISEGDIKINRGLFTNAVAGDIIRIYGTPESGAKIALEPSDYSGALDGANWAEFSTSPFELVLTDALLNTVKAKDLLIRGEKYTFTKAVLYSASAIGSTVYALKVTQPTAGGTIKLGETAAAASQDIAAGESVTLTASPAEGYHLDYWTKDDTNAGTESTLTFTMEADVTVTASFSNKSERVLKEESVAISEGDIKINRGLFTNAVAGDIIRIYGTPESGAKIALEPSDYSGALDGANWAEFSTSPFELVLTDALLNTVKAKDLLIRGEKYTFTKAVLYTESELGTDDPATNYTLTTAVTPTGSGSVKVQTVVAETATDTEATSFASGTNLKLTATANEGYEFSKWLKNGEAAGTEATLTVTMNADVTIEAVFKGSKLNNEERRTLWESSTGEALTWSDMMVQPAEVGEIVEAGEILIVTTSAVDTSEGHYPKIELRDKDGKSLASIDPLVKGENRLSITSAMATKMAGGFKFQGESATLLKLELYKPTPITKLAEKDSKTLWQNDGGETLSWNTIAIDRAAEWGSVLEEDERFIISVKAKESGDNIWPTIQLQDLDGQKLASTATLLNDVKVPGDIVITLTAEMVEKLKNGFSITGDKATITKAVLYKPALPTKTVKMLNDTETAITGDALVTVSAAKLVNISAYDVLTVNFAINAETAKLVIKCNGEKDGWDYIKEMEFSGNETLFALPLTESAVALLKANGLGITGSGYTFKSVTIKTAGEVADDEKEEDDISNADATEATKKVFAILKDLYGKKIVSGVVANVDWNTKEAENVYGWTGKYPAINVYDFINLHASKDVNSEGWLDYSDISSAKNWWKEGGIVGVMWHWQVKANNGTDYTCTPGTAAGETSFDASKVYVEGTSENTLAKQQLDQLCGYLKKMQDAGIPVVWRPLHEGSGNVEQYAGGTAWFWWGAKGADVYKKLWQWMYNYMVKTKGLNNLIWVWTSQTGDKDWYPGDAYVDIIGRDNYGATAAGLATEYEELKEAYPNKMITLSECGNSDTAEMAGLSDIWNAGSRWSWFMTWYDSDYNAGSSTTHKHTSKSWWTNAVAKDYVVTRDQMKELLGQESSDDSQTGVNISLDELNEGWSSSYDASTKTITTEGEWAARGWYIGDDRYNSKGSITVKYEAVTFGVTLKMEYTNTSGESKSVSAGAAAGETEVELDIPADVKTIEKVYITYQPIGKLKLTAATVNDKVVDNRTEKTLVEKTQAIADGDIEINRGLFSNAEVGDVLRIYATGLGESSKIALQTNDYSDCLEGANWAGFTESPFILKLTATLLEKVQAKNLLVRGENFTFTKATLFTEKNLGDEVEDGGDEPDEPAQTGVNISLDDLNDGWSSTYDATTKTITTEGEWAARGWYIGDNRYNSKGSITVKFEAATFGVTLKMEYTNTNGEGKSVSAGAAAGETEVELDIPADVKTIEKVYITYQPIGKLKLTAVSVNDKVADNRTEKSLVEKTQAISDGDIEINRGLFSNAVVGDVIRIFAEGLGQISKIALEPSDYSGALDGANWTAFTESPFELKLTATALKAIQEKGLMVRGENFTFTKAMLYTEGEIGEKIDDGGNDNPDDPGEEAIFNEDGEADLTKLEAQDEKTTTVTENEDKTVSITTTEAYKGAQIWFNTPEKVSGNTLVVEIAESNVAVTVTVRYTDGTESSSTSKTVSRSRLKAQTRMADVAGTVIYVPVDEGKYIQAIEVKPSNAGTVTILNMKMITLGVFSSDGVANLAMLKPQSGVVYDTDTYTLATTKGWTGATLTATDVDDVSGIELLVTFEGTAQVKLAVTYADGTQTDMIMEEPGSYAKLTLDPTKKVKEITIQPTSASIIQLKSMVVNQEATPDPVPEPETPVFDANGKADLSRLTVQDATKVMYNAESHKLVTTEG